MSDGTAVISEETCCSETVLSLFSLLFVVFWAVLFLLLRLFLIEETICAGEKASIDLVLSTTELLGKTVITTAVMQIANTDLIIKVYISFFISSPIIYIILYLIYMAKKSEIYHPTKENKSFASIFF